MNYMFWNNTPRYIGTVTVGKVVCIRNQGAIVDYGHIKGFSQLDGELCLLVKGSDETIRKVGFHEAEIL